MLAPADEWKRLCPGIGHIARDVEPVLAEPQRGKGNAMRVSPRGKRNRGDRGENQLTERAAVEAERRTEKTKEGVARFMEGQVRAVEYRNPTRAMRSEHHPPGRERVAHDRPKANGVPRLVA